MAWQTKTYTSRQTAMAALAAIITALSLPLIATAQKVASQKDVEAVLTIEKVSVANATVAGEIRNRGRHSVRDVQLLIRHVWLWQDERKPAKIDPSSANYYTLPAELEPGTSLPFTFTPPSPLPTPAGGNYEVSVTVAGFAQVIPPGE